MVDTRARGHARVARGLFLWGLALFLPGMGALWYANGDAAVLWECEGTTCWTVPSPMWQTVENISLVLIVVGTALAATGYLMYRLPRRRP
ncbi:hypothetical protein [Streptomyces sp. NPDC059247]|uniref:hypothetical protein n=1 Tax=Streptomyces sp. NPDC059247 TaxID=3346790 RepID=UPI00368E6234